MFRFSENFLAFFGGKSGSIFILLYLIFHLKLTHLRSIFQFYTSKNTEKPEVFRRYKVGPLARNGLNEKTLDFCSVTFTLGTLIGAFNRTCLTEKLSSIVIFIVCMLLHTVIDIRLQILLQNLVNKVYNPKYFPE